MRAFLLGVLGLVASSCLLSGCLVRERRVAVARPAGCHHGVWVDGHHGRDGRWHPGYWRCPGVAERVVY